MKKLGKWFLNWKCTKWWHYALSALLGFLLLSILCSTPFAADVKLAWDPVTGAASYKVYMSTDQGATWTGGIAVGNVTTYTYTGASDTVLVLFKVSAISSNGTESKMDWSGAFWDSRKKPLDAPYGLGVK